MSRENYPERQRRNNNAKAVAEHDCEPWCADDIDFLMAFFAEARGKPDAEQDVAEALGRTIEACRQRFYEVRNGTKPRHPNRVVRSTTTTTTRSTVTEHYIGSCDEPDDQWWSPDYYK